MKQPSDPTGATCQRASQHTATRREMCRDRHMHPQTSNTTHTTQLLSISNFLMLLFPFLHPFPRVLSLTHTHIHTHAHTPTSTVHKKPRRTHTHAYTYTHAHTWWVVSTRGWQAERCCSSDGSTVKGVEHHGQESAVEGIVCNTDLWCRNANLCGCVSVLWRSRHAVTCG